VKARKICMLGDFAVGKTSLVSRFVHSRFSGDYLTTVGVGIDTKDLVLPSGDRVRLVVWDIAGKSELARIDTSYLKGASGYLLVADTTRPATLESLFGLQQAVERQLGDQPFSVLLNKSDLAAARPADKDPLARLRGSAWPWTETSALTGNGV
jgi:small GTP-binding protein